MKKPVYLDHNATTPLDPEVLRAMLPYLKGGYGNASSVHRKGREARKAVEEARRIIGDFLGTESVDVVFTSGGTESNNFAIKGVAFANQEKGKHLITSAVEHPAVLEPVRFLEKKMGFSADYLPVDKYGMVDPEAVRKAIRKDTILVSIMSANNEVGTIQPIREIGRICRESGVPFHTDAVQSFGKLPLDAGELAVDLLSASAHKIYGPKGVGLLYLRKGTRIFPLQHGGHHERKLRAGTENVAGIVGFGKAVELRKTASAEEAVRVKALRDRLERGLRAELDHVHLNGHPGERLPGTLNMSFEYIEGEGIILRLDAKGICASTGSACTSGSLEPSHVLTAMGVDPVIAQGSIRFSLGAENTEEQIDYTVRHVSRIVKQLRKMSPLL